MTDDKLAKPLSAELVDLVDRAAYYGKSTIADRTRKTYATEFGHFRRWAESRGLPSLPPDVATVAVYLAALADGNVEVHWVSRWGEKHSLAPHYGQHSAQAIGAFLDGHQPVCMHPFMAPPEHHQELPASPQ